MSHDLVSIRPGRLPAGEDAAVRSAGSHVLYSAASGAGAFLAAVGAAAALDAGSMAWFPVFAAGAGTVTGYVQARFAWRREVPALAWVPHATAGWTLGALSMMVTAVPFVNAYFPHSDAAKVAAFALGGTVAGLHAGVQQARVLRTHGRESRGWVALSTAGTGLAWLLFALAAFTLAAIL